MVRKILLSGVLSVLLASSVVLATNELPPCTVVTSEGSICTITGDGTLNENSYCIDKTTNASKPVIYVGTGSSGACSPAFGNVDYDEGLIIFNVKISTDVKTVDLNADGTLEDMESYVIYDCGYGKCLQTTGFALINDAIHECTTAGCSTTLTDSYDGEGENVCKQANAGKINSASEDELRICMLKEVTVDGPEPVAHYEEIKITGNNHFVLKPQAKVGDSTFAGSAYNHITLIKSQPNIVVRSYISPELPTCTSYANTSACKVGTADLSGEQACIYNTKIYKTVSSKCAVIYGEESKSTGIMVFQKTGTISFTDYREVTSTLNSITLNAKEYNPFFAVYDCTTSGCIQTAGFVRYKTESTPAADALHSGYEFVTCYTKNNLLTNVIGCVKINEDHTPLYSNDANWKCNQAKGTSISTYRYKETSSGGIFHSCSAPKIGDSPYDYKYISINTRKGLDDYFFFENGSTFFPDTNSFTKVFLIVNEYSAVLNKHPKKGFYLNAGTIYPTMDNDYNDNKGKDAMIKCTIDDVLSSCSVVDETNKSNNGYYLNGGADSDIYPLIYCSNTENGCRVIKAYDGYYKSVTNELIQCKDNKCGDAILPQNADTCAKVGDIYVDNVVSPTVFKLCKSTTASEAIEIKKDQDLTFLTLTLTAATDFPGATSTTVNVIVRKDGSVIRLEEAGLPSCPDTIPSSGVCVTGAVTGQHCLHKSGKLYRTTADGKCEVSGVEANGLKASSSQYLRDVAYVFFNEENYRVAMPMSGTVNDVFSYRCKVGSDASLTDCFLAKGYFKLYTGYYQCSGWKGDGCTVSTSLSSGTKIGELVSGSPNRLQFSGGSGTTTINLTGNEKTIVFQSADFNQKYGKYKDDFVFLSINSSEALVIAKPQFSSDTYFFNPHGTDKTNALIKCSSNGTCVVNAFTDADSPTSSFVRVDGGDPSKKTLIIKSANDHYEYTPITDFPRYYISEIDKSKLIVCNYDSGCEAVAGGGTATAPIYYIDSSTETNYISCNGSACTSTAHGGSDSAPKYYIDSTNKSNMIICNDSGCRTNYGSTTPGHAYLDSTNVSNIIICSPTNGCTSTAGEVNVKYIISNDLNKLISCTAGSGTGDPITCSVGDAVVGIYVDGTDTSRSITCTDDGCNSTKILPICTAIESANACKIGEDTDLGNGMYCYHSDGNIYYTKDGACKALGVTETTKTYLFTSTESTSTTSPVLYKLGEFGDISGIIYKCGGTTCKQLFNTYYLEVKTENKLQFMYGCDNIGTCTLINKVNKGAYLAGVTSSNVRYKYTSLIDCREGDLSKCKYIEDATSNPSVYYLNGMYSGDLIECNNNECYFVGVETKKGYAYVDGLLEEIDTTTHVKGHRNVIRCSKTEKDGEEHTVCTSEDMWTGLETDEIVRFVDGGSEKYLECSRSGCEVKSSYAEFNAVDSFDSNITIRCATNGDCNAETECRVVTGVNCNDNTYYLVMPDATKNTEPSKDGILKTDTNAEGFLYKCLSDSSAKSGIKCNAVKEVGIFINKDSDYFVCSGTPIKCKKNVNTGSLTGQLTETEERELGFCLSDCNTENRVIITFPSEGVQYYLMTIKSTDTSNPFISSTRSGDETKLIEVGPMYVRLALDYDYANDHFVYTSEDQLTIITENVCPANGKDPFAAPRLTEYTCTASTAICTIPSS